MLRAHFLAHFCFAHRRFRGNQRGNLAAVNQRLAGNRRVNRRTVITGPKPLQPLLQRPVSVRTFLRTCVRTSALARSSNAGKSRFASTQRGGRAGETGTWLTHVWR